MVHFVPVSKSQIFLSKWNESLPSFLVMNIMFELCNPPTREAEVKANEIVGFRVSYLSAKGATKLYFMCYSRVVIILFNTGLYRSGFSTYSFDKIRFSSSCVLIFHVSVSLAFLLFSFSDLCLEFNVISKVLITSFNLVLTLFKRFVKI